MSPSQLFTQNQLMTLPQRQHQITSVGDRSCAISLGMMHDGIATGAATAGVGRKGEEVILWRIESRKKKKSHLFIQKPGWY